MSSINHANIIAINDKGKKPQVANLYVPTALKIKYISKYSNNSVGKETRDLLSKLINN